MVKLVVLIIDSDTEPVYAYNRQVWRSYMASDNDVQCIFVRMDEAAPESGELRGDTLYVKGREGFIPAILQKTVAAFEFIEAHYTYDYILRTNLSSFYVFSELKKCIETLPKNGFYGGVIGNCGGNVYASGAGFIMSKDVVIKTIENKHNLHYTIIDDVAIGKLLTSLGHMPTGLQRYDLCNNTYPPTTYPEGIYHIRVKNEGNRIVYDRACLKHLLATYYGITLTYE